MFSEHFKIIKITPQTMDKDLSFSTNSEMPESQSTFETLYGSKILKLSSFLDHDNSFIISEEKCASEFEEKAL